LYAIDINVSLRVRLHASQESRDLNVSSSLSV